MEEGLVSSSQCNTWAKCSLGESIYTWHGCSGLRLDKGGLLLQDDGIVFLGSDNFHAQEAGQMGNGLKGKDSHM